MTVATFDDVWIKEGMATLLAAEADRSRRDGEGKGRLFGSSFGFNPADAIRDRRLTGLAKYTSGPYQRAAWLLTQIRARVGEATFWQSLRKVLADHRLGSVDSETFLRSLGLDEKSAQKAIASLDEKRTPVIDIAFRPLGATSGVTFRLDDPGGTMMVPIDVTVVDADGRSTSSTLAADRPLDVQLPPGGYLALDESDVHPDWRTSFATDASHFGALVPFFFPSSDAALTAFASRSAAHQDRALGALLGFAVPPDIAPRVFTALYAGLDSTAARRSAELVGCLAFQSRHETAWSDALAPLLSTPALTTWSSGYANCETDLPARLFGGELAELAPRVGAASANRWTYLSSYDYGSGPVLDALSQVATAGVSLQLREQAITRLSYQATPGIGYSAVSPDQVPRWKDFFRARLAESRSALRFQMVWRGVVGLLDEQALSIAATKLHALELSDAFQRQIVCDALAIAKGARTDVWLEFQRAAEPWDTLSPAARGALADGCSL